MRVRLEMRTAITGAGWQTFIQSIPPRRLERAASVSISTLPTKDDVATALSEEDYDRSPWDDSDEAVGFRNRIEGWLGDCPGAVGDPSPPAAST